MRQRGIKGVTGSRLAAGGVILEGMTNRRVRVLVCCAMTGLGALVACGSVDAPPPFPEGEVPRDGGATPRDDGAVATKPPPPGPDSSMPAPPLVLCSEQTTVGEPLTCAWLQSNKNCWADALAVIESCPSRGGMLSADGVSCPGTTNGSVVTFEPPPLTRPVGPNRAFDYKVTAGDGGQRCYTLGTRTPPATTAGEIDISITTPAGCTSAVGSGILLTIACPGGVTHTGNFNDLAFACKPPGAGVDNTHGALTVDLTWGSNALGKDASSSLFALDCSL